MPFKKKNMVIALVLCAAVSPFILFSSSLSPWQNRGLGWLVAQEVVLPLEYGWNSTKNFVVKIFTHYIFLVSVAEDNDRIKKDLELLQMKLLDYNHQVAEAVRLRTLLGFSQAYQKEFALAEILGYAGHVPFQALRIGLGKEQGVRPGMPVVAAQGIVGKVLRSGYKFADVQLLVDENFYMDVLIERTRVRGVLNGFSESECRLQMHRKADIKIGDTIVSSGFTGSYPKGIPVGRITRISYESENVSQVITIQPWVDPRGLEEVMVLKTHDKELASILDTAGESWIDFVTTSRPKPQSSTF